MGLEFEREAAEETAGSEVISNNAGVNDEIMVPGQTLSTKTVMVWAVMTLLVMLLRRRLFRLIERLTASWKARGARPGGRLEITDLGDRID